MKTYINPYWENNNKDKIMCQIQLGEGEPIVTACVSENGGNGTINPDWTAIMDTFTIDQIDKNTTEYIGQTKELEEQARKEQKERDEKLKGDMIFGAKLEAFEIPEVKLSKNRSMKSKIRKAKSLIEIQAYAAALVMMESDNAEATQ